jgi:ribosomal protein S18 acetylase RimI-like enzyme
VPNVLTLEPYRPQDRPTIEAFVAAIQEHERQLVPQLRTGAEIAADYAAYIVAQATNRGGVLLLARDGDEVIGFVCAWMGSDDDPLLAAEHRAHAYVSDLFVRAEWRGRGIGKRLLGEIERLMAERGCKRLCITAKAANIQALRCYEAAGLRPYEVDFWKEI